jgi:DNA-binding response OmpR family regulator
MLRVLIVEDDPGMNDYIGDILSKKGIEVASAFNGFSGLDSIRSSEPNLVILDIFMPEKDGLEMLVELRRFASSLPVLVISGKQHLLSGCSMSLAKQLGASDVLPNRSRPKRSSTAYSLLPILPTAHRTQRRSSRTTCRAALEASFHFE